MRHPLLLLAALFAGGLGLGCDDQESTMAPSDPAISLSVERSIQHFAFGGGDDQHVVIFGATAEKR
jgi:hypothetical protein